jgi:hypothetical protein
MKMAGKISILLNVVLFGGLIFLTTWRRPVVAPMATTKVESFASPVPAVEAEPHVEPELFRWSQLDSKDYHVYVKNLRAIGCPEPTLRAIVTADVDSVYQMFANQLEQKIAAVENGSWSKQLSGSGSEAAMQGELQRIPDEEERKIEDLLGFKPAPAPVASVMPSADPLMPANGTGVLPMVLMKVDPATLNLTDEQKLVIDDLRQKFLEQIKGTNQDPNDVAYQTRWHNAQVYADNMLRGMLGNDIFGQYQMMQVAANNQAVPEQGQ